MKDRSEAAIQYSGYPLSVADNKIEKKGTVLQLVKMQPQIQTTFIQQSLITNDPTKWDVSWFSSYE
jgi:hypothetical protein